MYWWEGMSLYVQGGGMFVGRDTTFCGAPPPCGNHYQRPSVAAGSYRALGANKAVRNPSVSV